MSENDTLSPTKAAGSPYTAEFFNTQKAAVRRSANVVVPLVITALAPRSVVDVGCGNGTWLATFHEKGVTDVLGVDGEYVDRDELDIPGGQFLPFDLTKRLELDRQFDLVMSLEVAEHLPWSCADGFVESLTRLGSVVLFSAAVPHQGGTSHVNEQWPEFWAARFRKHGYVPVDFLRRQIWSHPDVVWWYAQNLLFYVRSDSIPASLRADADRTDASALSLVHPEGYLKAVGWDRRARETVTDLDGAIRPGERFLWIDDGQLADAAGRPHDAVPFLRVHGEYWGPPADGQSAIVELQRLRREGVRFAVFAWPAFWWFDHYRELTEHLQSSSRCVFENDRLVVFELQ